MADRFAIVVPAHNAARHLRRTVESVRAQTVADWRLVIVDDCSDDETLAVARALEQEDARIQAVTRPNGGPGAARNSGLARSDPSAPFVSFLDADDVWEPDALEVLLAALEASPRAPAAHGRGRYIDSEDRVLHGGEMGWAQRRELRGTDLRVLAPHEPTTFESLCFANCIPSPGAVVIRRTALDEAGAFDEDRAVMAAEDYDLWLRLSLLGPLAFVDRVVLGYRVHGSGISGNRGRMERSELGVRRKLVGRAGLSPEQRDLVQRSWRRYQQEVAAGKLRHAAEDLARARLGEAARQVLRGLRAGARSLRPLDAP